MTAGHKVFPPQARHATARRIERFFRFPDLRVATDWTLVGLALRSSVRDARIPQGTCRSASTPGPPRAARLLRRLRMGGSLTGNHDVHSYGRVEVGSSVPETIIEAVRVDYNRPRTSGIERRDRVTGGGIESKTVCVINCREVSNSSSRGVLDGADVLASRQKRSTGA